MIRKRPKIPRSEVERDYGKKYDPRSSDFLFNCDWEEVDCCGYDD